MITKTTKHLLTALVLLSFFGISQANAMEAAEPKVIGLLFYSDSCGSCKVLDPKIETAKNDYTTEPILFVTFDHSNAGSKNQAALLADSLSLGKIYDAQKKASGYMLLVDPKSGKVITKLTREMSEDDIKAAFNSALKS
ncbi:TlpA family protein disulfide reductase [Rubellicoccus peritrichatus]|uniref:Thioredoxin domain-containing protein n=1 Tax=Rubellicoccus peritrichatus TaxID=3080537 RepID=A0AAQ3LD53_9BACT|nr:thioredoxin domain-containing protein [Puniceicoccus sp. CR14]WOO41383.1 thioredoxin domain-containing protein [Puniceicoccus sp. CR14]